MNQVAESLPMEVETMPKTNKKGGVVPIEPTAPMNETTALVAMIERAARDHAVDIEKFERLMTMRERVETRNAERAYNAAISAARGDIPPIFKNRTVDFTSQKGRTNYRHEDLAEIARTVDPVLKKYGLSYRFRSSQTNGRVMVSCIMSHADGHSETTTLEAAEDHSGNKNTIQAIGSAATYLQRYTLKLALGLAASTDDDGRAAGAAEEKIEDRSTKLAKLRQLIKDTNVNEGAVCNHHSVESLDDLPGKEIDIVISGLEARKRKEARRG